METAWLKIEYLDIPDVEGQAFHDWCDAHPELELDSFGGVGRRGWSSRFMTYLRGYDVVFYFDSEPLGFGMKSELIMEEKVEA